MVGCGRASRLSRNARRTIGFSTSHSELGRSPLSLSLSRCAYRSCVSPLPLPRRSLFRFPRVTHGSLPPDKHNGGIHRASLSFAVALPRARGRLSFAGGEDTYKVQYRYPYRDIPNIVASISSVARRGMPVWTWRDTRCASVARSRVWFVRRGLTGVRGGGCVIHRREYTKSFRLEEEEDEV